jgi:hypothetical protein
MMNKFTAALLGAMLLSPSAFAAPKKAKGQVDVEPNTKHLVVKGPVHVTQLVSNGTGGVRLYEVQSADASAAGCAGPEVTGGVTENLTNNTKREVSIDVAQGRLLCATLTEGTKVKLNWEGTPGVGGGSTNGHGGEVTVSANQSKFMLKGPAVFTHFATGGNGPIEIFLAVAKTGTDSDCQPEAPPPAPAPAPAGGKPAPAPAPAPAQPPPPVHPVHTVGQNKSEKANVNVGANEVACARMASGTEGKITWSAK